MHLKNTQNIQKQKERYYYLDNLKVLLTCLVIMHHSAQAYGPTGGEWIFQNSGAKAEWLGNFMTVNASFFLGLFFMISGFFIPLSFKDKKISTFISRKLKRLMLPVLFILTVIVPIYFYLVSNHNTDNKIMFIDYYINTYWKTGIFSYEYGWYMVNLFMYSLVYAIVITFLKKKEITFLKKKEITFLKKKEITKNIKYNIQYIILLAALVGVISSLVRLIYPIDTWIDLLGIIGMEPAHITQYVLFFIFGVIAYNNNYFENITKKLGCIILSIGLFMALIIYLSDLGFMKNIMIVVWNTWAFYESFMAVFISIGLIVIFREYFNKSSKLIKIIAQNTFGAFVFHNLFVIIFQLTLDDITIGPSIKFFAVSILSISASFMISYFSRKIDFVKEFI